MFSLFSVSLKMKIGWHFAGGSSCLHISSTDQWIATRTFLFDLVWLYLMVLCGTCRRVYRTTWCVLECFKNRVFVCLLGFFGGGGGSFDQLEIFFTHLRDVIITSEGLQILTCVRYLSIEQWGFFSVPHLLWHATSVYNGHLRGPVILTYVA